LLAILRDNVVKEKFVQFNNDFTGHGVEGGMARQGTFQSFCCNVSAQV